MSATTSPILNSWRNLSDRERTLVSLMSGLVFGLAAIYLVLLPGLDAARSAQSRRDLAASDLAEVQTLAQTTKTTRANITATPIQAALQTATDLATNMNITQTSAALDGDAIRMSVTAANSADILNWAMQASTQAAIGLNTLDIQRAPNGVSANLTFARTQQAPAQ